MRIGFFLLLAFCVQIAQAQLSAAEYYVDHDPGPGNGNAITLISGSLPAELDVSTNGLQPGWHNLFIRAADSQGDWGVPSAPHGFVVVLPESPPIGLSAGEWYLDADGGLGAGTEFSITYDQQSAGSTAFDVPTAGLAPGRYNLFARVQDAAGAWGVPYSPISFWVLDSSVEPVDLAEIEYFLDADPGLGQGTSLNADGRSFSGVADLPTSNVAPGWHTLHLRAGNTDGDWGILAPPVSILVLPPDGAALELAGVEYYLDSDPGPGLGTPLGDAGTDGVHPLDLSAASAGWHTLHFRGQANSGLWGVPSTATTVYLDPLSEADHNLTAFEYFTGPDPGRGAGTRVDLSAPIDPYSDIIDIDGQGLAEGTYTLAIRPISAAERFGFALRSEFNVANSTPIAGDISTSTEVGTTVAIDLPATDFNGDALTASLVTGTDNGSVTFIDATATYAPNAGYQGEDSFTYRVSDGTLVSDPATVTVTVGSSQVVSVAVTLANNWNMVGVPVDVTDPAASALFPSSTPNTLFEFVGSYRAPAGGAMTNGTGYWLRFPAAGVSSLTGLSVNLVEVTLSEGWNMISGPNCSTDSVNDPAGLLLPGTTFGFSGSYVPAGTFEPGSGYWVRASSAGTVTIDCQVTASKRPDGQAIVASFPGIRIEDAQGYATELFLRAGTIPPGAYTLPPQAPGKQLDVSFADRRYATDKEVGTASISQGTFPLKLSRIGNEPLAVQILDGNQVVETLRFDTEDQIVLASPTEAIRVLSGQAAEVPTEFSLGQNYPNPFNPATTIQFWLPKITSVDLSLFDVLGRQVLAVVVDRRFDAGVHSVQLDASKLPSGTYLYRIRAGDYSATRRMVLLK